MKVMGILLESSHKTVCSESCRDRSPRPGLVYPNLMSMSYLYVFLLDRLCLDVILP